MKNIFRIIALFLPLWGLGGCGICYAQTGLLQKEGVYVPHLTVTQRNAIASPTSGQMIYNTDDGCLNIYKNGFWEKLNPYGLTVSDKWTKKASFNASGRYNAVAFSIGNKGYIGTGQSNSTAAKDFWEYDPSTNVWTQKADLGGLGRYNAVGFSIGTKGYLGTGFGSTIFKDFWEYNPNTDSWTQKADFGGEIRINAVSFSIGNKGFIGTGLINVAIANGGSINIPGKDFWEYNPTNDLWTKKANVGTGFERTNGFGFSIGSKGYIGSGLYYAAKLSDFWEYDAPTDIWTQKQDFAGGIRVGVSGFAIGNKGYASAGFGSIANNDLWEYDPIFTNVTQQENTFNGANQLLQLDATALFNTIIKNENYITVPQFSFLNGWINYGIPHATAYYKDDSYRVNLRGFVFNGTTTAGTTIFTLPSGYRPSEQLIFIAIDSNGLGRIDVLPTGEVQIHAGGNNFVSLDNISFRANGN